MSTVPIPIISEDPMRNSKTLDPVATARTILADRHRAFTVSTASMFAICYALVDAVDDPQPVITTELAEAARAHIAAEHHANTVDERGDPALLAAEQAREVAFKTFKTAFEQEFPNVAE